MTSEPTKIKDLKLRMANVSLTVKVVQKSPVVTISEKAYTSATVEDETGKIRLNLWREQVNQVSEGDTIVIANAFVHSRGRALQISTWSDIKRGSP